jgi:Flp pilus assembly protein TadG
VDLESKIKARVIYYSEKYYSERGSFMLFFAAGIFPLLVFMMALSLDVTNYMRADQRLQEVADDAALLAWRYLPYKAQAIEAVRLFIAQRGLAGAVSEIRMAPARPGSEDFNDEFEVVLEEQQPLTFMSYLVEDAALPLRSVARARITPVDVYIAVDRSSYVAPSLLSDPWINPVWSVYFRDQAPFNSFINPETGLEVTTAPAQFMTQLCFNSYFANIKRTAINLYEYFSSAGRNGVGIGVFPGIGIENLRNIRGVLRPGQNVEPSIVGSGEAKALQNFPSRNEQDYFYYSGVRLGASSWCAAAAASDNSIDVAAPISYSREEISTIHKIWKPLGKNQADITKLDGDDVIFNPDYQSALTVRESLWSTIAKPVTPNSRAVMDTIIANLAKGPDTELLNGKAIRGGLTGTSTRTGIILAGDVPHINNSRFKNESDAVSIELKESFSVLRQLITDNQNLRMKMVYVVIDDSSRPAITELTEIQDRTSRLASLFEEQQNQTNLEGRLDLQVIYSNNFRTLNEEVLASVVLDNTRKVLSY